MGKESVFINCGRLGNKVKRHFLNILGIEPLLITLVMGSLLLPLGIVGHAKADIIADASAPSIQQPGISETASGIPQVNIQKPSSSGVSRNSFSQFNVDARGVILNNSKGHIQTQLGGWIGGNPNLTSAEAKIILNEVNSSDPSILNGYIETAGTKADVIVANPAGISCSGCGFINTQRATLTTGDPSINNGDLQGFVVQNGVVRIHGNGLDAKTAEYTDIIARAVEVNAGIWAQDLNVVTGRNDVNYDTRQVTAALPSDIIDKPTVAVDVASLGGMYAGKIVLLGTENGVGVNNSGVIGASAGELTLTADGRIENKNQLWSSSDNVEINTGSEFENTGTVEADKDLTIAAGSAVTNSNVLSANATLSINSTELSNESTGVIRGQQLKLQGSDNQLANRGLIDSDDTKIDVKSVNNLGTGRIYGDQVTIIAEQLSNSEESGNAPVIASRGDLRLQALTVENRDQAVIYAADNLSLLGLDGSSAAQVLTNDEALIEAAGSLTLSVDSIQNIGSPISVDTTVHPSDQLRFITTCSAYVVSSNPYCQYNAATGKYYTNWSLRHSNSPIATPAEVQAFFDLYPGVEDLNYHFYGSQPAWLTHGDSGHESEERGVRLVVTVSEDQLASGAPSTSAPGVIRSGGNMQVDTTQLNNHYSQIVSGGDLTVNANAVINLGTSFKRQVNVQRYYQRLENHEYQGGSRSTSFITEAPVGKAIISAIGTLDINAVTVDNQTSNQESHPAIGQDVIYTDVSPGDANYLANIGAVAETIPSAATPVKLPTSALTKTNPSPTAAYLIETDAAFIDYKNWLTSDYFLDQIPADADITQKRLGDGYYEQQLIREQITQLTGERYLTGFTNDESQYRALMDNAVSFAQAYQLKPGIALSSSQMANLTSDIVWLVQKQVTLADGTQQSVLVPQIYLSTQNSELQKSGALVVAETLNLNLQEDVNNSQAMLTARDELVIKAANVLNQQGGVIGSKRLEITAAEDFENIGATLRADNRLVVDAGRDLVISGSSHEVDHQEENVGSLAMSGTHLTRMASVYLTGDSAEGTENKLQLHSGRNLSLAASQLVNNVGTGETSLKAESEISLTTLATHFKEDIVIDSENWIKRRGTNEHGNQISTAGVLKLESGGDVQIRAAEIQTSDELQISTPGNINIEAGEQTSFSDVRAFSKKSGFLSSKSKLTRDTVYHESAKVSTLSAEDVVLQAGGDIRVAGSNIVANQDIKLTGEEIDLQAVEQTHQEFHLEKVKKSGLISSGGPGFTLGSMKKSDKLNRDSTTLVSTTLGSLNGDIQIDATKDLRVTASDLLARNGDINLSGKNVELDSGFERLAIDEEHKFQQSGLTVALSGGVIDTAQQLQHSAERVTEAKNSKLRALQAWRLNRVTNNSAGQIDDLQHLGNDFDNPTSTKEGSPTSGINLSISVGSSKREQIRTVRNQEALGASAIADGNVNITARGDEAVPESGNIRSRGGFIEGDNVTLNAANRIELLSAENARKDDTQSKSSSTGIGISIGSDGLQVFAEASKSRGEINKSSDQYLETQINATKTARLTSGDDTTLNGAQINADKIMADVGGDLNIISQQDEEHYRNRQQSLGGKVGVGIGPNAPVNLSVNYSGLKADSEYIAVQEQTGLFAGEGGFDVQVGQNTDLQGGAIVSEASPENNRLSTETLSYNSLQNKAKYNVESKSISFSTNAADGLTKGFGGGFNDDDGEASNTTFAAISEGDIEVRANPGQSLADIKRSREQAHRVLERIFNEDKIREVQEEAEVQQILSQEVPQAIGDFAQAQLARTDVLLEQANNTANPEEKKALLDQAQQLAEDWGEGGRYRVALHTFSGALSGDLSGALGAYVTAKTVADISDALNNVGLDSPSKEALLLLASASIGGLTNGETGALNTLGQTTNNYLKHNEIQSLAAELKGCADRQCQLDIAKKYEAISEQNNQKLAAACSEGNECNKLTEEATKATHTYQRTIAEGEGFARNILLSFAVAQTFDVTSISQSAIAGRALEEQGFSEEQVATATTLISAALGGRRVSVGAGKKGGDGPEGNSSTPNTNTTVGNNTSNTETYFRVEGGGTGNKTSQNRITANTDGTISINPGCSGQLCVSVGNADHASYYLTNKRPDGSVVVFEVDAKLHKEIMDSAIPQRPVPGIPRDPNAPKVVDPNQPGTALELPKVWESLLEKKSSNARVLSQDEFFKEFGK